MDVLDHIKVTVAGQPIVLFMKGTPKFPMCGYSSRAVSVLKQAGARFRSINVLEDPVMRASLPRYANWPTFPQLFIQGELIGGCDIIEDLDASGQLERMVADLEREHAR